jgi:integrase
MVEAPSENLDDFLNVSKCFNGVNGFNGAKNDTPYSKLSENSEKLQPQCPKCGSFKSFCDGVRKFSDGTEKQRYLCRECSYRFSFPPTLKSSKVPLKGNQICAKEAKNLASTTLNGIVGDNEKINNHIEWMKREGYKQSTIDRRRAILYRLQKLNADLENPESVKTIIAEQNHWKASQKQVVVFAYDLYAKQYGYTWNRPWYEAVRELPFIPQEREIDDLIAGVNKEISLLLLIAKETGARAGEVYDLLWTDIDFEGRTLSIRAEKNSNPRRFKLSKKLQNLLECYPKTTERIFNNYKNLKNLRRTFEKQRKQLAFKLCNPRLNQIKIHTLRHWKGTTEYDKTKDILHVMQTLGHKNIKNTLLYTQLVSVSEDKGYICKIAKTPAEAVALIEDGFEEHTSFDNGNVKLFRKRK